ncbi:MAG: TonB-dependent receptor, partial [Thermodesulfobacteriota bacterium]
AVTYETGVEWGGAEGRLTMAGFHTTYSDKISAELQTNGDRKYENIDGWTVQGLELQGQTAFDWGDKVTVRPHATARYYTKREQDSQTIQRLPEYEGQIGLAADLETKVTLDSWLEVRGPWEDVTTKYPSENITKDPFALFGVRLSYAPVTGLQTYLDVENLFDKRYSYNNGYPMPGRSVTVGIEYTF